MNIVEAVRSYEHWLREQMRREQMPVSKRDLRLKHRRMTADPFSFLRGTYFRWLEIWPEVCPELADAPRLLAVGDLHVENFGTWRDSEGRLVWGVNDVDETAPGTYTLDLVRLATSALLAYRQGHLTIAPKSACKAILKGYGAGLHGVGPFVLEEGAGPLRIMALSAEREPDRFWAKLDALRTIAAPSEIRKLLACHMPQPVKNFRIVARVSGVGSLGRPRYTAIADQAVAHVAREAKAIVPPAVCWRDTDGAGRHAHRSNRIRDYREQLLAAAIRCPDPTLVFVDGWQIRRLGPHCARIDLAMLPRRRDERTLLTAMGFETANLHFASRSAIAAIRRDLAARPKGWLFDGAERMAKALLSDWKDWKRRG
ncbi:MAG TPA: DUF2252 family protein [Dongiaceae bacterium]